MRLFPVAIAAVLVGAVAPPAAAASFAELVAWCAPEQSGGRPGLCSGYLETYLPALASPDPVLNGGVRACVPETTDRAEVQAMIQAYSSEHPESSSEPGVVGLGRAMKDRYPCPE